MSGWPRRHGEAADDGRRRRPGWRRHTGASRGRRRVLWRRLLRLMDSTTTADAPTSETHNGAIDALAWILVRDRKLLSVRTKGKDKFYLPGGKREPGESDVAALCREVREELGVTLDPLTFTLFAVLDEQADGYPNGRLVHQVCYLADFTGDLKPQAEIAELDWLTTADTDRCPLAGRRMLEVLREAGALD